MQSENLNLLFLKQLKTFRVLLQIEVDLIVFERLISLGRLD
jgi:hypothetical protein